MDDRTNRPHGALRAVALTGAALAAFVMALMMAAIARGWGSAGAREVPWLALVLFAAMLALLWSGLSLSRAMSTAAFVVFTVSALMGLPFALLGLAVALAD
jgi:hypothetical protein